MQYFVSSYGTQPFKYVKVPGIWYYLILFFLVPDWPWVQNG